LARLIVTLLGLCFILTACNVASEYVHDRRFDRNTGAVLRVRDPQASGLFNGTTNLDIYDFKSGCPDLSERLKSSGYEGSVELNRGHDPEVILPTDRRIVLKLDWSLVTPFSRSTCMSGVMFNPEPGSEYLVQYRSPAGGGDRCGVDVVEIVAGPHGDEAQEVERVVLDLRMGWTGVISDRLCGPRP